MYDSILTDIKCCNTGKVNRAEVQINWTNETSLRVFNIGDTIPYLHKLYDNTWVKTDYLCHLCSKKVTTSSSDGSIFSGRTEHVRHVCYVNVVNGKILEVLSEPEYIDQIKTDK